MADFVAVIRKAVDNLSENTPENRNKVYTKARSAIRRQLEAINPPPSDEVVARQLAKLDQAIEEVEIEHAEALPADLDETDALMSELESMVEKSPVITDPEPAPRPAPVSAPVSRPAPPPPPQPKPEPLAPPAPAMDVRREPIVADPSAPTPTPTPFSTKAPTPEKAPAPASDGFPSFDEAADEDFDPAPQAPAAGRPQPASPALVGDAHDEVFGLGQDRSPPPGRPAAARRPARAGARRAPSGGLIAAGVIVLVLCALAFAGWSYRDSLTAMFGSSAIDTPVAEDTTQPQPEAQPESTEAPAPDTSAPTETAAADPEPNGKFNQRLNPDGTEVDAGPAPGPATDDPVEGRSVAELTEPGAATPAGEAGAPAETPAAGEAAAPAAEPLGVAQKMILYEERLGQQSLEVKQGTVVWSLVNEPSDGGGPDETVIRGEINNPDKGLSALVTIKRNTDPSLPASHIIEVVFALPPEFEGGSIDQLQRIAMKQTEADQGNPLIAVPAKITQDFYMVALNDLPEARETNTRLLRERNWIDIPVVYANGRQALITLEKGASGTEVFNKALDAWDRAAPQN
ncbi:hypothetical protein [Hoeflea olei]|uniref:Uncharacterized protein n=1 Tax=Hoeflea olei TaxID=1480615 RepID=A0A1C1Z0P3_9HYPH|nr:hypothetical protein [Hoeflea olei]OCW59279.1 hypothetical protein AWJ14_09535 [Hoeflea olei]